MAQLHTRKIAGFGWRPDLPDQRDCLFRVVHAGVVQTPPAVDLTPELPPVFDQGDLGSCVGNSTALMHAHVFGLDPRSRLEIYYEARKVEGETKVDSGCQVRDAMKVLATLGAGAETLWPYDIAKFAHAPPRPEMQDAAKHKALTYSRLQTRTDFRQCLAAGYVFAIGFTCYDELQSDLTKATGVLTLPKRSERAIGGHAVVIAGYDSDFRSSQWAKDAIAKGFPAMAIPSDVYIVRNSWGADWGRGGNFAIDARYLENPSLADDAWTMRPS